VTRIREIQIIDERIKRRVPDGGDEGDVLVKVSGADGDIAWSGDAIVRGDDCPEYKWLTASTVPEGDVHLSSAINWNTSRALIHEIGITTTSTDWDLFILHNDNGYSVDDALIPKLQVMEGGNGNEVISLAHPFRDEDDSGEVHLYWRDNVGSTTYDVYVIGTGLA